MLHSTTLLGIKLAEIGELFCCCFWKCQKYLLTSPVNWLRQAARPLQRSGLFRLDYCLIRANLASRLHVPDNGLRAFADMQHVPGRNPSISDKQLNNLRFLCAILCRTGCCTSRTSGSLNVRECPRMCSLEGALWSEAHGSAQLLRSAEPCQVPVSEAEPVHWRQSHRKRRAGSKAADPYSD